MNLGFVSIAAGVCLTLFGVRFLRKGLDRLFGGAVFRWVSRLSRNRLHAFGGGMVVGLVAPSSTGLAVLGAQWLGRDPSGLNPTGVLAVMLGAGVGLTVTVQLLSFQGSHLASVFILAGVAGYQFCRRDMWRGIGQCLLALGFIFLAMAMIGDGAQQFTAEGELRDLIGRLENHRGMLLVAVSGLTVFLQSSTATIAFGLVLAANGLVSPEGLVPWVLGTNVGLGFTSLLMGWSQVESRRLGLGNILAKLLVALPLLWLPSLAAAWFETVPGTLMRQTAMLHTLFNVGVGFVALPLLTPLHRLTEFLAPKPAGADLTVSDRLLDPRLLDTPSIALARATRETLRMGDHVRLMLENYWHAFSTRDVELARRVQKQDDVVDRLHLEIKDYLVRIGENRTQIDGHWQFTLLTFSAELEAVGDLVDKHLCDALIKQRFEGAELDDRDGGHLAEGHARVLRSLDAAIGLMTTRGVAEAEALVREKHDFNEWCRDRQRAHYERLAGASRQQLAGSSYFVDSLNALRRINSHISTIGYAFLGVKASPAV
jgi:phosphate:Na+ symporter